MKIESYQVQQTGMHQKESGTQVRESLTVGDTQIALEELSLENVVSLNTSMQQGDTAGFYTGRSVLEPVSLADQATEFKDAKLILLESFMLMLSGRLGRPGGAAARQKPDTTMLRPWRPEAVQTLRAQRAAAGNTAALSGAVTYQRVETHYEAEQMNFRSSGTVKTQDGQVFSFDLNMELSRAYYEQSTFAARLGTVQAPQQAGNMVDPLVIVFGEGGPTLSDSKHTFDLDADGVADQISFATGNSGFLALDKNGDGAINDGSELFGPTKGNGFQELRDYDSDGNGWIDENDEIFNQLVILSMSADGKTTTFKLADVGIGAIYLNDVGTQYAMQGSAGAQGMMQSSSVYLRENGTAGSIHHIDLAI